MVDMGTQTISPPPTTQSDDSHSTANNNTHSSEPQETLQKINSASVNNNCTPVGNGPLLTQLKDVSLQQQEDKDSTDSRSRNSSVKSRRLPVQVQTHNDTDLRCAVFLFLEPSAYSSFGLSENASSNIRIFNRSYMISTYFYIISQIYIKLVIPKTVVLPTIQNKFKLTPTENMKLL